MDKIKEIFGFGKFDDIKILINADDKLLDYIPLKYVVITRTYVIKDDGKLYLQLILEKILYND